MTKRWLIWLQKNKFLDDGISISGSIDSTLTQKEAELKTKLVTIEKEPKAI